jgi:hypothetical protein
MGECFKEREGLPKQVYHISPIHKGNSNTNCIKSMLFGPENNDFDTCKGLQGI